jgi:hypothetical protein
MIRGLELTVLAKSESFEITYMAGEYSRAGGGKVEHLLDMHCYVCSGAYYTLEGDAIDFCPHCGHFDRIHFTNFEDLATWSKGQDWKFLKRIPQRYFAVAKDNRWTIRPAEGMDSLARSGRYDDIRRLDPASAAT